MIANAGDDSNNDDDGSSHAAFLRSNFSLFMQPFLAWSSFDFFQLRLFTACQQPLLDLRDVEHDHHVQQQQHNSWVFV